MDAGRSPTCWQEGWICVGRKPQAATAGRPIRRKGPVVVSNCGCGQENPRRPGASAGSDTDADRHAPAGRAWPIRSAAGTASLALPAASCHEIDVIVGISPRDTDDRLTTGCRDSQNTETRTSSSGQMSPISTGQLRTKRCTAHTVPAATRRIRVAGRQEMESRCGRATKSWSGCMPHGRRSKQSGRSSRDGMPARQARRTVRRRGSTGQLTSRQGAWADVRLISAHGV